MTFYLVMDAHHGYTGWAFATREAARATCKSADLGWYVQAVRARTRPVIFQ
jgi:hypothetical protein